MNISSRLNRILPIFLRTISVLVLLMVFFVGLSPTGVFATDINNSAYVAFYIDKVIDGDGDYTTGKIMKINKEGEKEIFENQISPINQPVSFKKKGDYMYWSYINVLNNGNWDGFHFYKKSIYDNYLVPATNVGAFEFYNLPGSAYFSINDISYDEYYKSQSSLYERGIQPYKGGNVELSQDGFNLVKDGNSEHLFGGSREVTWNGFFWVDENIDALYYKSNYYDGSSWKTFWGTYSLQDKQKNIYEFGENIPTYSSFDTDLGNSVFCSSEGLKVKENSGYINNLISTNGVVSSYWMHGVEKHCLIFAKNPLLTLTSSTPTASSTGVVTNTLIALNFSETVDKSTVPGNIVLRKTNGSVVDTWAVDYSGSVITFHATSPLDKNTSYTVELKTGLKDTNGNALGSDSSFYFITASEPAAPSSDGNVASTALSPICSRDGYSLVHPECSVLNALIFNANMQTVLNGSEGGSPAGDPVSLPTGEFTYSNTLMHQSGDGLDYDFALAYKSQAYSNGPVGISWDHSYNTSLRENTDNSVTYFDGKFGTYTYSKNTDGAFSRIPGIEADLVKENNEYELRFTNGTTYTFGTNLKIASIRDKDNHSLTFAYDADNKLISTTDTLGRVFTYDYYDHGRMKSITDFSGRSVTLNYYSETDADGSAYDLKSVVISSLDKGRLGGVTGTEINPLDPPYQGESKAISFTYQKDPTSEILSHNILSLTDSSGKEYVKNIYDPNDRVVSQKFGDGTLTYTYETVGGEGSNKNHITKTTAINKRGMKSEFTYDANGNTISKKLYDGDTAITTTYTYASNGKIATETKPLGNGTSYLYDIENRLTEKREKANMTEPNNDTTDLVTRFEYQTDFPTPTKITDPAGNIITTALDTKGNITETKMLGVKKANGLTYDITNTFVYDTNGHLITKTDGEGNQTNYEYNNGKLTKVTEGAILNPSSPHPDPLLEGEGVVTMLFSYDSHGNLLTTTDGEGNTKQFSYDQYDRLISSLSPEGIMSETVYDANNNKTEQKVNLENGTTLKSTSTYDILDQVTGNTVGSSTDDQRITTLTRDTNGNITETVDQRGLKTKYSYDIFDRATEKRILKNPTDTSQDIVTKYTYDQNGNIVQTIDARNNTTTYEYDHFDRMITTTNSLGTKTLLTYDKQGNVTDIETKDSLGKTLSKTERGFDSLGHVIRETQGAIDGAVGITTTVDYDANGKPVKVTDAKGNITTVTYDSLSRKKTVTDGLGNQTILTYDKRGLVVKQTILPFSPHPGPLLGGEGVSTMYSYDKDGRLISKTDNGGNKTTSLYNKLGQVTQVIDANNNKTDYTYDVFGNVLSETKYLSGASLKTSYEYNTSNNPIKLTDANGNITTYEYDSVNRLIKETLADGSFTTYEYDAANNITKKTDNNGTVVNNIYDQLNRLTKRSITRGTNILGVTEENYSYDALGRLTSSNDSEGNTLSFTYDSLNRLIKETQNGKTVETQYDPNGNQASLTYPSGKKQDKTYDILNRLTGISLDGKSTIIYSYDSLTLNSLTLTNGAKTTYGYDSLLRLKELTNISNQSVINKLSFGYDKVNNILTNGENNYSYDAINRLTSIDKHDNLLRNLDDKKQEKLTIDYNYDNLGNRDSVEQTTTWMTKKGKEKEKTRIADYMSNTLNQYTQVSSGKKYNDDDRKTGNNEKFTYDRNGNLTDDGRQKYMYDYRNRLVKVESYETNKKGKTETNLIAEFKYDVLGRRTTKTTYNDEDEVKKIIRYTYANQDAIEETTSGIRDGKEKLKDTKEYLYGKGIDDVLVAIQTTPDGKKQAEKKYFYQKNQLGSITAITDDKGKLVEEYKYDEFGKAYTRKEKKDEWKVLRKSEVGNVRLFTGREYDKEIGLYYYRARYYSADLGRFLSRDPIGVRDNINLYSYVGESPVGYVDAMGLSAKTLLGFNPGNNNSVRIIYDSSMAGHIGLQVGNKTYSYGAKDDETLNYMQRGIISFFAPGQVDAELGSSSIDDALLGPGYYNESENLVFYDLKTTQEQRDKLQEYITSAQEKDNKYGLLGVNCTAFVMLALFSSNITNELDPSFGDNIPLVYKTYLDELSKGENGIIEKVYNYETPKKGTEEYSQLAKLINANYNINVDFFLK